MYEVSELLFKDRWSTHWNHFVDLLLDVDRIEYRVVISTANLICDQYSRLLLQDHK